MTKTKLTTLTFLLMLISTTLSADAKQQNTQAPCSTRVECDVMAEDFRGEGTTNGSKLGRVMDEILY